jgi:hypothetical protein
MAVNEPSYGIRQFSVGFVSSLTILSGRGRQHSTSLGFVLISNAKIWPFLANTNPNAKLAKNMKDSSREPTY